MVESRGLVAVALLLGASSWPSDAPALGQGRVAALPDAAAGPKGDFDRAYSLAEGEDIKALRGEAIAARDRHFEGDPRHANMGEMNLFAWDGRSARYQTGLFGSGEGAELTSVLTAILGLRSQEIEGDLALLRTPIRADFLARDGVPADRLVPQLDAILRRDFGLPIRLALRTEARDLIVVSGRYRHKPDPAARPVEFAEVLDHIEVYAREVAGPHARPRPRAVMGGDLDGLLSDLGQHFGVRFVNEVRPDDAPKIRLAWRIGGFRFPEAAPVEDQGPTLDHVAEQTGLTFAKARREVRILQVDRVE